LAAGPVVFVDDRPVTVVGVVARADRAPDAVTGVLLESGDAIRIGPVVGSVALLRTAPGAAQQVARQAPLVLLPTDPGRLQVDAPPDPRTLRDQVQADVRTTLVVLTGAATLASVVGLANAMVLAVIERAREYGLRRALGARRGHVTRHVMTEALVVGVAGGAMGLLVGLAGVVTTTLARHWTPVFDLRLAPLALAGGVVVGALGGLVAAARAGRIQPGEALRL
jgi:macrolide transport system ATP-binding/permease protein